MGGKGVWGERKLGKGANVELKELGVRVAATLVQKLVIEVNSDSVFGTKASFVAAI